MTHALRRIFMDVVKDGLFDFDRRDVERVLRDDKWIKRCLVKADGDVREAVTYLLKFCDFRSSNDVYCALKGQSLQDYKKIIRIHGKDKKGRSLLTFNISELEHCKDYCPSESFVGELIVRWFEEMESGKDELFSVVFYHGKNKCMESAPQFLLVTDQIQRGYCNIVETFYIFEDVLSFECRQKIQFLRLISGASIKYVKQDTLKEVLDFDVVEYEKQNLEFNKIKEEKPEKKEEEVPVQKTCNKKKKKNNRNVEKKKNNEDSEVENNSGGEGGKVEERGGGDAGGEEKGDKNDDVKNILKRLHDIQTDLNNVIRDVMKIL